MDSKRQKICKKTHVNSGTEVREDGEEMITDANRDTTSRHDLRTETENSDTATHHTLQDTGSDSVRNRSSRAAAVCLGLLCVLLLTAVIVLCVELSKIIGQFNIKYGNLTNEINKLNNRKSILDKNITNLSNYNKTLILEKQKLQRDLTELWQKIHKMDGWKCYQSSLYFISNEPKSWTESRRDCRERGADLIIINNREEQEFLKRVPGGTSVWTGLTHNDVEGTWKWVDDSNLTSGLWTDGEPLENTGDEDCAINLSSGLADYSCNKNFKWICEKNTV